MTLTLMLDNNVVLDRLLKREPHYEMSSLVCLLGFIGDASNNISVTMLTDIYYTLSKTVGASKAHDILIGSLDYFNYCNVTSEDAIYCLEQRWDDFEDCLVARSAENINADYIVTRNKEDFSASTVPALTPAELLELLEHQEGLTYKEYELSELLSD